MTGHRLGADTGGIHVTTPEEALLHRGKEPRHETSASEAAADLIARGVAVSPDGGPLTEEQLTLQAGDPDADPDSIATAGDDAPGGANGSPDDGDIDQLGELYGVAKGASSADGLVLGEELIARRDADRWENNPDSKDKSR